MKKGLVKMLTINKVHRYVRTERGFFLDFGVSRNMTHPQKLNRHVPGSLSAGIEKEFRSSVPQGDHLGGHRLEGQTK
jgi:hypothetical protein